MKTNNPILKILVVLLFTPTFSFGQKYFSYVACESEDQIVLVSYDGNKAAIEQAITVGYYPTETEGPHGVAVSTDDKYWFVSMAHGNPYGTLYKYEVGTNKLMGSTTLGLFPATMQMSPVTGLLYIVNFNLHGDMVASSISVVDPETMIEIDKIQTGVMPHGSRVSTSGMKHYSLAMTSGELYEIDALQLKLTRVLDLDNNKNIPVEESKPSDGLSGPKYTRYIVNDHGEIETSKIKPTWVVPHPDGKRLFIAGNGMNKIYEIDLKSWSVVRSFPTGKGPYNIEISPNGKYMVATYKSEGNTGIWDIEKGEEIALIKNTKEVSHGVAISDDSKIAFVTAEGRNGEPGAVDIISLESMKKVASLDVGKQAGGVVFLKQE